jgi:adenylate cyclase
LVEPIERKLTTILAADVEGYTRLMAADEAAALQALREARAVFAGLIERHRGRFANTASDGLIADFPSVVEAVQCAAEGQTELAVRGRQRDPAMRFRIGVHLGDVMVDGSDLFGDGANLAARPQAMAEPGGVLISQAVYDQVRRKLAIGYEFLGERRPKNLDEPVPVYRLLIGGGAGRPATDVPAVHADAALRDRPEPAEPAPNVRLRQRVAREAQLLAVLWAALAAVKLATGTHEFWAVWPGIAALVALGLRAAPLQARGWPDVLFARLGAIVLGLAMVNLAGRSDTPWFLWPAGALLVLYLVRRTLRPQQPTVRTRPGPRP